MRWPGQRRPGRWGHQLRHCLLPCGGTGARRWGSGLTALSRVFITRLSGATCLSLCLSYLNLLPLLLPLFPINLTTVAECVQFL
jgi:hypothetical protein